MQRVTAILFGLLVLVLGVVGVFTGGELLFGLMNVDVVLDITRLTLAALLLNAAIIARDQSYIRKSLLVFAITYLAIFLLGSIDRDVFGLLPSGLTGFDLVFHLTTGLIALVASALDTTPETPQKTE